MTMHWGRLSYATLLWLIGFGSLWAQIDVERVMTIGRNALHYEDYVVSIAHFNQVIALRPWLAEPYFYRSVAKINLEDYSGAETDASATIERNPFLNRAYLVRAVARQNQNKLSGAIEDYRSGLSLLRSDYALRYNLALALTRHKDYAEAEQQLDTLERYHHKSTSEMSYLRAGIALERGDTVRALSLAHSLEQRDSTYAPVYRLMAQVKSAREDYKGSQRALDRAITLEPRDAELYTHRGIVRYHLHNLRGAMADYSKALELDPHNRIARHNRALLDTSVGEYNLAIKDWDELIKREPNNYIARYNRAIISQQLGLRAQQSLEDLGEILFHYPNFADGFVLRSQILRAMGRSKEAGQDLLRAFELQRNRGPRATVKKKDNKAPTRSETDEEIEKYNQLVETLPDATASGKVHYSSNARGLVQDRDIQVIAKPMATLSYFDNSGTDGTTPRHHYLPLLSNYNAKSAQQGLPMLYLSTGITTLNEEQVTQLQHWASQDTNLSQLSRAVAAYQLQDPHQARTLATQSIEQEPQTRPLALLLRALAEVRIQELNKDSAQPSYGAEATDKAIPSTSLPASTLHPLPSSSDKALQDLNTALQIDPSLSYAYYNRALLHESIEQKDKAIADYTRAIESNRQLAEAYYNRALLLLSIGKAQEGKHDLGKAGELGLYEAYNIIKRLQ